MQGKELDEKPGVLKDAERKSPTDAGYGRRFDLSKKEQSHAECGKAEANEKDPLRGNGLQRNFPGDKAAAPDDRDQ